MKKKQTKKANKPAKKHQIVSSAKSSGKIIPLGSRVLIKPFTKEDLEKKNNFGIILPDSDSKEKSEQGKVIAVGVGEWKDGKLLPVSVSVGDVVAFSKYGYDEVVVDGEEYFLVKEENILAVLK
jgi:chaperonin GroES